MGSIRIRINSHLEAQRRGSFRVLSCISLCIILTLQIASWLKCKALASYTCRFTIEYKLGIFGAINPRSHTNRPKSSNTPLSFQVLKLPTSRMIDTRKLIGKAYAPRNIHTNARLNRRISLPWIMDINMLHYQRKKIKKGKNTPSTPKKHRLKWAGGFAN